jgi:anaerobic ribonucleoside-triphosphate reductase
MAKMTVGRLHELFNENVGSEILSWQGVCHDCECSVEITATAKEDGIHIEGGGIYEPEQKRFFLKCNSCFQKNSILKKYQPCEVYSRVVGYLRPVAQWNDAKQSEFKDRKLFDRNISGKNYRVENQNTDNLRTNAA